MQSKGNEYSSIHHWKSTTNNEPLGLHANEVAAPAAVGSLCWLPLTAWAYRFDGAGSRLVVRLHQQQQKRASQSQARRLARQFL